MVRDEILRPPNDPGEIADAELFCFSKGYGDAEPSGVTECLRTVGSRAKLFLSWLGGAQTLSHLQVKTQDFTLVSGHVIILTPIDTTSPLHQSSRESSRLQRLTNVVEDVGHAQVGADIHVRDPDPVSVEDPDVGGVQVRVMRFRC